MGAFWQDIKYGARVLLKKPGFTAIAVLTLALGIGANTAIYSVVYSLIFRPLPGAANPAELVTVAALEEGGRFPHNLTYISYEDFQVLDVFSEAVAYANVSAQLSSEGENPERFFPLMVSGNYFDMLGVKAIHGRTFSPEEAESMGAGNVLLLGYDFWQSRFGGEDSAVGSVVRINGQPFTVIGVLPVEFKGTSAYFAIPAYVPVTGIDFIYPEASETIRERRRFGGWSMVARLRPGVGLGEARAAVATHAQRLAADFPESNAKQRMLVYPEPRARMEPSAIAYMPPISAVFMALVGLVLLIACANVANLLLARATGRQKEIAIRAALGAGRLRIIRQLLTESVMLALLGGASGLLLSQWVTNALSSIRVATDLPLQFDFHMDYRIFGFTLGVAVATGLVAGLFPAVQTSRTDLASTLKEGGRTAAGSSRHWLRSILVVSQVAVSLVLLISAALFVRTTQNAAEQDMGFDLENRLVVGMDTDMRRYDEERSKVYYRELLDRVRSLPGVISASTGRFLPIGFGNGVRNVYLEGSVPEEGERVPAAYYNIVHTDYFKTMGMPIRQGRTFAEADDEDNHPVVVINDTMAEEFWPDQNPLSKRFRYEEDGEYAEVIGVVPTVKFTLPAESPSSGFYMPFKQNHRADQILHVHTQGDPLQLLPRVRTEIQTLDADMPIWDTRSMETHIKKGKMVLFDLAAALVGGFGLIGMILASIGLYGVMAYSVGQRTHEIGIRMAMGASAGRILGMVLRHGMILTLAGITLGLVGASLFTRSFANLLVGVTPTDPLTFGTISLLLVGVALLAAYIPARRATKVDPMVALRYE